MDVEAVFVGQWAVHTSLALDNVYCVTDSETGRAMAAFSCFHVALNFARRVDGMFDVRGISDRIDNKTVTATDIEFMKAVKKMMKHECAVDTSLVCRSQRRVRINRDGSIEI